MSNKGRLRFVGKQEVRESVDWLLCRTHPCSNKKSSLDQRNCFLFGVRYCMPTTLFRTVLRTVAAVVAFWRVPGLIGPHFNRSFSRIRNPAWINVTVSCLVSGTVCHSESGNIMTVSCCYQSLNDPCIPAHSLCQKYNDRSILTSEAQRSLHYRPDWPFHVLISESNRSLD